MNPRNLSSSLDALGEPATSSRSGRSIVPSRPRGTSTMSLRKGKGRLRNTPVPEPVCCKYEVSWNSELRKYIYLE